ncbi:protein bunched, class 2/F/G isoform-like [Cylas formicarius]|uniref:protein bunched, class 2/F/G isoform-like n=1 Tax=Cylas formicarius TaxID=197179 RepID=UPI00295861D8|nr:protein bunched, class 2/F/G isoform-like [Cylas formicarius]
MANVTLKGKKGTVIHRTTSETLRLGEEVPSNQARCSQTARKKSQATSPSCSFQITGVLTRYDLEDESADDLDESHTDEISRVTDNETPSFSEDSRDDQQPVNQNFNQTNGAGPGPQEQPKIVTAKTDNKSEKSNINDIGRFRVVKVGSVVPFSRGRWTCYDYVDEGSEIKHAVENVDNSSTFRSPYLDNSCQQSFLYTGSILMSDPMPIFVPISLHSQSAQRQIFPKGSTFTLPKSSRVSFTSTNSVDTVISNTAFDGNQNEQVFAHISTSFPAAVDLMPTNANGEPTMNANDNITASVSCTATIDTKIEHALDVVKNHLTHTVRLEVEELKIKINELVERISYLEYENDLLRANVTPEVLATLGNNTERQA